MNLSDLLTVALKSTGYDLMNFVRTTLLKEWTGIITYLLEAKAVC